MCEEEDFYPDTYFYYIRQLDLLTKDAATQCRENGYFNVAWEIKDETISCGEAVLNLHKGHLSDAQANGIRRLLNTIRSIPESAVSVPNVAAEHLRAMNHPCWIPIRAQAVELLRILDSETRRVHAILWPD